MAIPSVDLVFSCFALFLGAIAGSFAGVIAERAYTGQSWVRGRSRCNACAKELTARDLVPVISWLASSGKCRGCKARIPSGYLIIEIALALIFFGAYRMLGLVVLLIPLYVAFVLLAAIVVYDLRHMIVPVAFASVFVLASLLYAYLRAETMSAFGITLITGGAIAFVLYLFYALSGGRVMGLGDAPMAFGLSLLAGPYALVGLMFSFWVGAAVGISLLWLTRGGTTMKSEVPFVPFLAAGYILAFFTQWNPFVFIGF